METTVPKESKVVVIGIDGLPYSLITEYVRMGIMPQMAKIIQVGNLYRMKSSLPEISSVAWTGFMTGCNPGEHGIFGFMELDANYGYRFPNFTDIKVQTIWEKLDLTSVIINIPETYPAIRPLKGLLISGFVALDLSQAVYPKSVYPALKEMGYRLDVKAQLATENPDAFFDDLFTVFAKRRETIRRFFEYGDWQLFIGTITETDRLHHYFYPQTLDGGMYHPRILEFYRQLDSFIGEMFERAKEQKALFLTCSDHGFCPITQQVYLNRWLMANGYLELNNGMQGLRGISETSQAFCLDPGRIYIHSQGQYPKGCVAASEYDSLRNDLAQRLSNLQFNGQPVVQKVFFREDIFSGPYSAQGPDLYLLANPGFDLKGAVNCPDIFDKSHFTGMHTRDDAHLLIYPQRNIDAPHIEDIAHIIETFLR